MSCRLGGVRVIVGKKPAADRNRLLEERLGLEVLSQFVEDHRQVV